MSCRGVSVYDVNAVTAAAMHSTTPNGQLQHQSVGKQHRQYYLKAQKQQDKYSVNKVYLKPQTLTLTSARPPGTAENQSGRTIISPRPPD